MTKHLIETLWPVAAIIATHVLVIICAYHWGLDKGHRIQALEDGREIKRLNMEIARCAGLRTFYRSKL